MRLTAAQEAEIETVINRLLAQAEQAIEDRFRRHLTDAALAADDEGLIDLDVVDESVERSRADCVKEFERLRGRLRRSFRQFVIDGGTQPLRLLD